MGSFVHSVDAASYHIRDGFVTFENGDAVPVASFATIHVRKVEREGAVLEAAHPHPQEPTPAPGTDAGQWVTPAFGWKAPPPPPQAQAGPSWPPVDPPVEAQPWERWTDVWRPAPTPAAPQELPSPVPDEHPASQILETSGSATSPPSTSEGDPGPADPETDDSPSSRDESAHDTGEWWIVDNPPAPEADPHQWWIVEDSAARTSPPPPAPAADAPGSEVSQPGAGASAEEEGKPPRSPRRRRERDPQPGWASSPAAKRTGSARAGDKDVPLAHQLRARRVWAMEETDPAAGEAKGRSPAPDQEEVGNVLRLPVETSSEDAAHTRPPEPKPQGHHFTVVSSFGSTAPEMVAPEGFPSENVPPESVAAPESVVAQEAGPEESGPAEPENVSPDLKELLDIAAVQAAVDAIVDAAVRGSSDELD
jgi:hypothetical protein